MATSPAWDPPQRLELLGQRMDRLAREFARTHDPKVKAGLERLSVERAKLAAT
jgi:hypothetical protein